MNTNPLSLLSSPDRAFINTDGTWLDLSGTEAGAAGFDGIASLSPFADVLRKLQELKNANPAEYAQVTKQVATSLHSAARMAEAAGNNTEACQLLTLSRDFSVASITDQLPNVADLAEAMRWHHRSQRYQEQPLWGGWDHGQANGLRAAEKSKAVAGWRMIPSWKAINAAAGSFSQLVTELVAWRESSGSFKSANRLLNTLRHRWHYYGQVAPKHARAALEWLRRDKANTPLV